MNIAKLKEAIAEAKDSVSDMGLPTPDHIKAVEVLIASAQALIDEPLGNTKPLTKDEFHSILSEFPPSIAEDSGLPEWTQGEIDKLWNFLIGKYKWIEYADTKPSSEVFIKEDEINAELKSLLLSYRSHKQNNITEYMIKISKLLTRLPKQMTVDEIRDVIHNLPVMEHILPSQALVIALAIENKLYGGKNG